MKSQLKVLGGNRLQSPNGEKTRPTTALVREALINILQKELFGCNWLDLFSGSGVIGCEVLQKGAKTVIAIESNPKVARICKSNLELIASKEQDNKFIEVINSEVIKFLKNGWQNHKNSSAISEIKKFSEFDFVYLDPPYNSEIYLDVLNTLVLGGWITKKSLVILECSSRLRLTAPKRWSLVDQRTYGKTKLCFFTSSQA